MNQWFEPFVAFFFPHVHRDIEWSCGWESLDKELQQVVRDAAFGVKRADKLVKVWRRNGQEAWLLIHLEFQSQREAEFERRMFVYHYRIFDLYNLQVVSLAVLGDGDRRWLPEAFAYDNWGCELRFRFPIVKLLTLADLGQTLETSADPIAAMVLAHLATLEPSDDDLSRFARKRHVIRSLYERGMAKQMVLELFRLIDWMITLPEALEPLFREDHHRWEEEKKMPYVTTFERLAREEGKAEGLREGLLEAIELGLKLRFGVEGLQCQQAIRQVVDIETLRRIKQALETATTPDDILRLLS